MKKIWMLVALVPLVFITNAVMINGCIMSPEGDVVAVEDMSETEFQNWQLMTVLGVKIGANRLLMEGVIKESDLDGMADVLEAASEATFAEGATSIFKDTLAEAGFTSDEVTLLLLVAEQQLIARGGLSLDDALQLSPRTKDTLVKLAEGLRNVAPLTQAEQSLMTK